jgi:hypothetical protein
MEISMNPGFALRPNAKNKKTSASTTSLESMTPNYMINNPLEGLKTEPSINSEPDVSIPSGDEVFQRVTNPRVQFLKLSTFAKTYRGIPGNTYPFCPSGPSLAREPEFGTENEIPFCRPKRRASPLQHIALSVYSRTQIYR